jgi:hypothetical protein
MADIDAVEFKERLMPKSDLTEWLSNRQPAGWPEPDRRELILRMGILEKRQNGEIARVVRVSERYVRQVLRAAYERGLK